LPLIDYLGVTVMPNPTFARRIRIIFRALARRLRRHLGTAGKQLGAAVAAAGAIHGPYGG
jgi:hypothetical protein